MRPGVPPTDLHYELVAYATGNYPVLPTVIRDTMNPASMHFGKAAAIAVLPPGEKSDDAYQMNSTSTSRWAACSSRTACTRRRWST